MPGKLGGNTDYFVRPGPFARGVFFWRGERAGKEPVLLYVVETDYDEETLRALADALRRSRRGGRGRRSRTLARVLAVAAMFLGPGVWALGLTRWTPGNTLMTFASVVLLITLLAEDRVNAWAAKGILLRASPHATLSFDEEGYTVLTELGRSRCYYSKIDRICETERYYFLFLDVLHGQALDKRRFLRGDAEGFAAFLEEKTGLELLEL